MIDPLAAKTIREIAANQLNLRYMQAMRAEAPTVYDILLTRDSFQAITETLPQLQIPAPFVAPEVQAATTAEMRAGQYLLLDGLRVPVAFVEEASQ